MRPHLELHDPHAASAEAIYDELVALHTASWRARGARGAFADPWFDRFHRRLLGGEARYKQSLATGATRLARLCVQRARLRFAIEDRVRQWKHAVAGALP
jgi:hypothetical protein